jgi:tetratricopeptide (TPR) repeat protein
MSDGVTSGAAAKELEERLQEAAALTDSGDEDAALALLTELERDHADDATLLCMLGVLASHFGSEGMAADYFRRCLEQEPTDPAILVKAGAGLVAVADPGGEAALRLAAITAPDFADARRLYGGFLVRAGLLDQGIEELLAARRLDEDDLETRKELGIAYLLGGRRVDALEELESVSGSEDLDGRLLLGLVLILEGGVDRGAEELYPLGEALPEDSELQLLLSLAFFAAGWEEEAWLALSRAEQGSGGDPVWVGEVEDALASGSEAVTELLMTELAPTMLRDRVYRHASE